MKGEGKRVVISTIYEGYAIRHAIPKLSPGKLILLIDEPADEKKKEKMYEVIKSLKDFFKEAIEIETNKISSYDLPRIMGEVINIIDKEAKEGNKIIIHITEGRKITSLALLFAAYTRKEKIEASYYITEEEHKLINLPMLNFEFNETKKILLNEIFKNNIEPDKLMDKLKIGKSSLYQNIQELKKEGCLEDSKELKLTELGRIMII
jgi:CRISPR locus-related DNA-binding protein